VREAFFANLGSGLPACRANGAGSSCSAKTMAAPFTTANPSGHGFAAGRTAAAALFRAGRRRPASTLLSGVMALGVLSMPFVMGGPSFAPPTPEPHDRELVVANMTADFVDFGVGRGQAEMLARQTADFGTLGEMTTVAAIGISVALPGVTTRRSAWLDDCNRGRVALTAKRDIGRVR
jgi:hypothetical protein